ncbi:MAG: hypothetical protein EGR23_12335 [Holdemanella biformis]|nr:hypothetical protein [Holdemanella biformis]
MNKVILSLDQALHISGWCIFEDNKISQFGHWEIFGNKPIEQRLNAIIQELNELYNKFEFAEIAFEDIQYQNNAETYKKLAFVQATIIIWCYSNDIKFSILSPSHWRSILKREYGISFGKKRTEQKKASVEFIKDKFNIEPTEDEADSICLGLAYMIEKEKNQGAF